MLIAKLTAQGSFIDEVRLLLLARPGYFPDIEYVAERYGLMTMVVNLEDVYDEFSHGIEDPNAIRASLGTIFGTPVAACTSVEALAFLRDRDVAVMAARVDGASDYDAMDLTGAVALVVGAETTGLSATWSGAGSGRDT